MGKGSLRRPEREPGSFDRGWERVFGQPVERRGPGRYPIEMVEICGVAMDAHDYFEWRRREVRKELLQERA